MRIALAGVYQESHSFSPALAALDQFKAGFLLYGDEIPQELTGLNHEISGALEAASNQEIVPLTYASAGSSGQPIHRETYDRLAGDILDRLREALPVDGVLMAMHGAMASEHHDDATGSLLQSVRDVAGPNVPIVATLDLHANLTRGIARAVDALVGYHTSPHIDQGDTGRRGMELLLQIAAKKVKPELSLRQIPMIVPGENGRTTEGPFSEVMDRVIRLEQEPGVLAASAYTVQPWLDLPEMGCSVVVVTDGDVRRAESEAEHLAREFWERRKDFMPHLTPVQEAIDLVLADERRPYVFSDSADAPSSGAPGDSTALLKVLLDRDISETALLNIVDPEAVSVVHRAGVGATLQLTVGAAFSSTFYKPVTFAAYVKSLSDGTFRIKGAGFRGVKVRMGRTAVVVSGGIQLVIMEQPVFQWGPELYRSQGLEPMDSKIVVAKSPVAFRAAYGPLAAEIIVPDLPGVCSPNFKLFPWEKLSRPIYPLDDLEGDLPEIGD